MLVVIEVLHHDDNDIGIVKSKRQCFDRGHEW